MLPLLRGDSNLAGADNGKGWELFEMKAYIKGNWKILRLPQPFGTGAWQLYDLEKDPGETTDVSAKFPDVFDDLKKQWDLYVQQNQVYDHRGHYDSVYRSFRKK